MPETPEEAYQRVLAEEQAKGSSPPVAEGRAKSARMKAQKAASAPSGEAVAPQEATPPADAPPPAQVPEASAPAPAEAPAPA
ncbi:MAG: hypothetical protein ACR2FO_04590 [Actinomycetota bacterium]